MAHFLKTGGLFLHNGSALATSLDARFEHGVRRKWCTLHYGSSFQGTKRIKGARKASNRQMDFAVATFAHTLLDSFYFPSNTTGIVQAVLLFFFTIVLVGHYFYFALSVDLVVPSRFERKEQLDSILNVARISF
ncbi:hypothetical protein QLX08_000537 [Tetragonisca angustula]|uniref:Uncharacterized protein n=1 Tax=Tetragonisca angustula TaxID=166442 RepID=A0AAW1AIW0_9HYME